MSDNIGVQLFGAALDTADHFEAIGRPLDLAMKRRDRREPGRRQKEEAEMRLSALMRRYWRGQAKRIQARLENRFPWRKAVGDVDYYLASDFAEDFWAKEADELTADLLRLLMNCAIGGAELMAVRVNIGLDTGLVNATAANWAARHAGELVRGINRTTLNALRQAVASFVDTPGFTVHDVMELLPYGPSRSEMIAVTEITRSYAQGQMLAAQELADQFPGVAVRKGWFTNEDDRVCQICGPMDGQGVDYDGVFIGGDGEKYQEPPAHTRCRCWIDVSTDILAS